MDLIGQHSGLTSKIKGLYCISSLLFTYLFFLLGIGPLIVEEKGHWSNDDVRSTVISMFPGKYSINAVCARL